MKTAFRTATGAIQFRDITLPPLKPNDIKVKIKACGICGTDLHSHLPPGVQEEPFGHEISGVVSEIGCGVSHLKVGDEVALDSATPCGRCDFCRNKEQHLCTDLQSFYYYGYFGFAEEIVVPAICAMPNRGLGFAEATLQEPLAVALDLFKLADVKPNQNVLLIGAGPIGAMTLPLLRQAGANRIFVSDFKHMQQREALARSYDITDYIDPKEQKLTEYPFQCRIDRVLVTAPPAVLPTAMDVVSPAGIIAYIGIGWDQAKITFDADQFHFKKLQLRASFASPAHFGAEALDLLRRGVVAPEKFISHRFPFDRLAEALTTARGPAAIKVVVEL